MSVGVIGTGRMGLAMCRHLLAAGHDVIAYDVAAEALAAAEAAGARPAATLKNLGECSVVLVVVGFEREVNEVLFGSSGIADALEPGACVVVCASVTPHFMQEQGRKLSARSIHTVEAPVVRGEPAADAGTLAAYVGGPADAVKLARPVLNCFSSDVIHVGDLGAGQVAKALNNYLLWACTCADDEALRLGAAYGLDPIVLRETLMLGSGANAVLGDWARERKMPWAEKDMMIVLEMADDRGVSMPGAGLVKESIKQLKQNRGLAVPKSKS
jgi:3-hydroxyisobutyrate dehydrogenase-like beta-hydroxyacid dehydrogenase